VRFGTTLPPTRKFWVGCRPPALAGYGKFWTRASLKTSALDGRREHQARADEKVKDHEALTMRSGSSCLFCEGAGRLYLETTNRVPLCSVGAVAIAAATGVYHPQQKSQR
jgi:hypothetical protein